MREIEFRVFDLHDGKVLYGEQIPKKGNGLVESIRQLSGQTYELSQYTEIRDVEGIKIYEGDILEVLSIHMAEQEFSKKYTIEGTGILEYFLGEPSVSFYNNGEFKSISIHDMNHEFRVIGNRLENSNEIYS